jgi:hypothetical protein
MRTNNCFGFLLQYLYYFIFIVAWFLLDLTVIHPYGCSALAVPRFNSNNINKRHHRNVLIGVAVYEKSSSLMTIGRMSGTTSIESKDEDHTTTTTSTTVTTATETTALRTYADDLVVHGQEKIIMGDIQEAPDIIMSIEGTNDKAAVVYTVIPSAKFEGDLLALKQLENAKEFVNSLMNNEPEPIGNDGMMVLKDVFKLETFQRKT